VSTLYLVDDHALVREGIALAMSAAGHQVIGASDNPTQALAELLYVRPDVAIVDLSLGDHSGFELLEQLQRRGFDRPIVILTMSLQPRHLSEAFRLGALSYVSKGASTSDLLAAIKAASEGQRYICPTSAALTAASTPQSEPEEALHRLSARERQVIVLVAKGHSSASIGQMLHLSPKTVDSYRSRLMAKLGVPNMPALVRLAIRAGLVEDDD